MDFDTILDQFYRDYVILLVIKDEMYFFKGVILFRSRNETRVPFHAPLLKRTQKPTEIFTLETSY